MIYPITFGNCTTKNSHYTYQTKQDKRNQKSMEGSKRPRPFVMPKKKTTPMHESITTALSWFGFGIVLDRISSFASKYIKTSPIKLSIITNGIIALGAGAFTYIKSKKS